VPRRSLVPSLAPLLLLAVPGAALAQPPESADDHVYVIEATLDPEEHVVDGTARIHWTNTSETPARELWLHLYLNAFESRDTVFMRESSGSLRGDRYTTPGSIEVRDLSTDDGLDLLADADDEVVTGDRTQMRVPLPEAVPPGGSLDLVTRFRSTLPHVFARSGYHGSFHMVAQWFPKIARREADGTWATYPYHGLGEFYADFGRYDLTVTTPEGWVVGATGEQVEERRDGGNVTRRFVAAPVHDTAFCAWDHFRERTVEGRSGEQSVEVRFLYPPGWEPSLDIHVETTLDGLERFGELFGEYPYPTLTVIVPPRGADGAAGMEYPTLFLTAGPWFPLRNTRILAQEAVTAHELAHQWFQGMVATDEATWPMLDEGLTQWSTGELMRHRHGRSRSAIDWAGISIDFFEIMRVLALRAGDPTPPPGRPAHAFRQSEYGRAVYGRTAIVVETIARTWGRRRLERALGTYAREQRFAHPGPDALYDAFDRTYWRGFSRRVLEPALMDGATADVQLVDLRSREAGDLYVSEVDGRRAGELDVPTWIELRADSGERFRVRWPAGRRELRATHSGSSRITSARVDPDGHLLLDPSVLDDVRGRPTAREASGLTARLLFGLQQLLSWVGP